MNNGSYFKQTNFKSSHDLIIMIHKYRIYYSWCYIHTLRENALQYLSWKTNNTCLLYAFIRLKGKLLGTWISVWMCFVILFIYARFGFWRKKMKYVLGGLNGCTTLRKFMGMHFIGQAPINLEVILLLPVGVLIQKYFAVHTITCIYAFKPNEW